MCSALVLRFTHQALLKHQCWEVLCYSGDRRAACSHGGCVPARRHTAVSVYIRGTDDSCGEHGARMGSTGSEFNGIISGQRVGLSHGVHAGSPGIHQQHGAKTKTSKTNQIRQPPAWQAVSGPAGNYLVFALCSRPMTNLNGWLCGLIYYHPVNA